MTRSGSSTLRQLFFLASLLAGGIVLSLTQGATTGYDPQVFWLLRLPRTLCAIAVGGGLSVAGTLIQAGLGNPLADPYTIGIASAAALGAVVGSLLHLSHPLLSSSALAFLFALISVIALSTWLKKSFRHSTEILLAGVVTGFFFTSLSALVMALADPAAWSSTLVWLLGSLGNQGLSESAAAFFLMLLITTVAWLHWKPLDLLAVDDIGAESLGLEIAPFRRRIFFIVALITGVCVSIAGVIGFLGLIIPHTLRRLGILAHCKLIPYSFLAGATLLLFSDTLARTIARPAEIPVGVLMALIGAPFFLAITKTNGGRSR